MTSSPLNPLFLLLLVLLSPIIPTSTAALNSTTRTAAHLSSLKAFCNSRPYPAACFNSLKLSISINISPNILSYLLHTLQAAISDAAKLSDLLSSAAGQLTEHQKGSLQDCKDLHQITLSSLQKSIPKLKSPNSKSISDARTYLSAALTNKNTCLEGLDSAAGPSKPALINSVIETYKHVSNSLSMIPPKGGSGRRKSRRLLGFPTSVPAQNRRFSQDDGKGGSGGRESRLIFGFPTWVLEKTRRFLQDDGDEYDPGEEITVAADGSGNYTTISEAINYAPNNSVDRVIIFVKEGVYKENVEIPSYKTNIVLIGDGSDVTVITGSRSFGDGWTTFRSATLAVSGDGFLARDITIENTAGPEKHQASAVRINADLTAMYRCTIDGFQDTLYVHSFRQFYRECDIYGTIDYIFGNAAVVFQACNIVSKLPLPSQFTVITAQSREIPEEDTGISIQNCSILATEELYANSGSVKSYLGRPWRPYSRVAIMQSYVDGFVDPTGWTKWSEDEGVENVYYGEYDNSGDGGVTNNRVDWEGFHVMDYYDAYNFSVSYFISGDEWLDSTSFPYYDGI